MQEYLESSSGTSGKLNSFPGSRLISSRIIREDSGKLNKNVIKELVNIAGHKIPIIGYFICKSRTLYHLSS